MTTAIPAGFVIYDNVDWELGKTYEMFAMGLRMNIGVLNRIYTMGEACPTHDPTIDSKVLSVTFWRASDNTTHAHGCFAKSFYYRAQPERLHHLQNKQIALVPTLHVKYTLVSSQILEYIKQQIRSADVIFFESLHKAPTRIHIPARKLFGDIYTPAQMQILCDLFKQYTDETVTVAEMAVRSTAALLLPTRAFCRPSEGLDEHLAQYAATQGKKLVALDRDEDEISLTQVIAAIEATPEYTMHEAQQQLMAVDGKVKRYQDTFYYKPPSRKDNLFGLSTERNARWRTRLAEYMQQFPTDKVLACVGCAHVFAHDALADDLDYC